jgi:hypothetical protein
MKKLENKPMFFMGDNHGDYERMFSLIKRGNIENSYFIHLGDGGEGFSDTNKQMRQFVYLNDFFKNRNINYMSIRGNHSDPFYFTGDSRIMLSNFELIEDYTVMEYNNKLIQFIGGAISIDRVERIEGKSYWAEELVRLDREQCQKVDVLVTHTAPSHCYPQKFNSMVYNWSLRDAYLLEDLTNERKIMDEIYKICQPSLHLYGHFHYHWTENINGCEHRLLDIDEIWEYIS